MEMTQRKGEGNATVVTEIVFMQPAVDFQHLIIVFGFIEISLTYEL